MVSLLRQPLAMIWCGLRPSLRRGTAAIPLLFALAAFVHPVSAATAAAPPFDRPAALLSPVVALRSSCPFDPSLLTLAPAQLSADTTIYIIVGSTAQADEVQAEIAQANQTRASMGLPPLNVEELIVPPGDTGDELLAAQAQIQAAIAAAGPTAACLIDQRTPPETLNLTP
ncbi:MAG: hypothetical protein C4290_08565 [Chloroflexota bacterium]